MARADSTLETTAIRVIVDDSRLENDLRKTISNIERLVQRNQVSIKFKVDTASLKKLETSSTGMAAAAQRQKRALDPLHDSIQRLKNISQTLRNEYEADIITKKQLAEGNQAVLRTSQALAKGLDRESKEYRDVTMAAARAARSQATLEGRLTKLGLSGNVAIAMQQSLNAQLTRFGPLGSAASMTLGNLGAAGDAASVGLTGASLATGGVIAGLVAIGAAGAALIRTGIPEVKAMQASLNILNESGASFTQSGLTRALDDAGRAAGRAGQQFSRADMATALKEIVKAGLDADSALDLLTPGMQLASITGDTLNDSTSRLLANLRQFGLTSGDAGMAADALATADLAAAHGAKELSEGLATVGPVASAAGLTLQDTLGILVELDNKGLDPADKGATALRGTLSALLDPTAKAKGALADLGVSLRDSDGNARPLLTVLRELQEALKNNREGAQKAAEIFDTRAVTAILNMSDASAELTDALNDSEGAAAKLADTLTRQDLQKAQTALSNAWKDLANTFTTQFAANLTASANAMAAFLGAIDDFAQKYPNEPWWVKGLTGIAIPGLNEPGAATKALLDYLGDQGFSIDNLKGRLGIGGGASGGAGAREFVTPGVQYGPPTQGNAPLRPGAPPPTEVSLASLISKARSLLLARDAASGPSAIYRAEQALDAFKASDDRAAAVLSAVSSSMRDAARDAKDAATKSERTAAQVRADAARSAAARAAAEKALGGDPYAGGFVTPGAGSAFTTATRARIAREEAEEAAWWANERARAWRVEVLKHRSFEQDAAVLAFDESPGRAVTGRITAADTRSIVALNGYATTLEALARAGRAEGVKQSKAMADLTAAIDARRVALARSRIPTFQPSARLQAFDEAPGAAVGGTPVSRYASILATSGYSNYLEVLNRAGRALAAQESEARVKLIETITEQVAARQRELNMQRMRMTGEDRLAARIQAFDENPGAAIGFTPAAQRFSNFGVAGVNRDRERMRHEGHQLQVAADILAKKQTDAALEFASTVVGAGRGFASAISAFQAGNTGGGVSGLFGAAGGVLGILSNPLVGAVSGGTATLVSGILGLVGPLLGDLINLGGGTAVRPAPQGGLFGTERQSLINPDIALAIGSSQASLGPAISSKILDAGNLFMGAAGRIDVAADKFAAAARRLDKGSKGASVGRGSFALADALKP